jgi:decaprenyl-phosphate phosphoribosyltransferase
MSVVAGLVRTARPQQWVKNVLVLAAPGAAGVLTQHGPLLRSLAAFAVFCVTASGTYFLNDSLDVDADRHHPTKRSRPVAAGMIDAGSAKVIGLFLLAGGLVAAAGVDRSLLVVVSVYVALQVGYSLYLKHQPIYDLAAVTAGFVLRGIGGGVAAAVPISEWFLIVASFGSLMMVTGKRIAERTALGTDAGTHRATLDAYSPAFLRIVLAVAASGAVIGYCVWTFDLQVALRHHADPIWYQLSIVPMTVALLRYTFLAEGSQGGEPEALVAGDRPLLLMGAVWAVLFGLGVYAS